MKRTLKFSLNLANTNKIQVIKDLSLRYKKAVNHYLSILSSQNKYILAEKEVKSFDALLSYRYKQCAKRQAIKIWKSFRRARKKGKLPEFDGTLILDNRFIKIEKAKSSSFDWWVKIATLNKGRPVLIPFKSYDYANDYFNNWKLINGGRINHKDNNWFLLLTFERKTPPKKKEGKTIGIDIGIKKLIATSEGNFHGKEIEPLMNKIQRKQQGSKAFKKALKERDYYINRTVKELPYTDTRAVIMENIKNIKRNTKKEKRLRKEFRSKFQRWTYPLLAGRINQLCELNGVHFLTIDPAWTSQTCSSCGFVHKLSRNGEIFKCRNCGYTQDADYNASLNILNLGMTQQHMVAGSEKVSQMDICPLS
jgi:putative transposase